LRVLRIPEIFSGTVDVDETYLGGQWKNKRKSIMDQGTKCGRGTVKVKRIIKLLEHEV
jgi:hypothetical protein